MDAGYLIAWGILTAFAWLVCLLITWSFPAAVAAAALVWCLAAVLAWADEDL